MTTVNKATRSKYDEMLLKAAPHLWFDNIDLSKVSLTKVAFEEKPKDATAQAAAERLTPQLPRGFQWKKVVPKNKTKTKGVAAVPKAKTDRKYSFEFLSMQGAKGTKVTQGLQFNTPFGKAGFCHAQCGNWDQAPDGTNMPKSMQKPALEAEREVSITNNSYDASIETDDGGSRSFIALTAFLNKLAEHVAMQFITNDEFVGESEVIKQTIALCKEEAKEAIEADIEKASTRLEEVRERYTAKGQHAALQDMEDELAALRKETVEDRVKPKAIIAKLYQMNRLRCLVEKKEAKDGYPGHYFFKAARPAFRDAVDADFSTFHPGTKIPACLPLIADGNKMIPHPQLLELFKTRKLVLNNLPTTRFPVTLEDGTVEARRELTFEELGDLQNNVIAFCVSARPMVDAGLKGDIIGCSVQLTRLYWAAGKVKNARKTPRKTYETADSEFDLSVFDDFVSTTPASQQQRGEEKGERRDHMDTSDATTSSSARAATLQGNNSNNNSSSSSSSSASTVTQAKAAILASTQNPPTFKNPNIRPVTPTESSYSVEHAEDIKELKNRIREEETQAMQTQEQQQQPMESSEDALLEPPKPKIIVTPAGKSSPNKRKAPPAAATQREQEEATGAQQPKAKKAKVTKKAAMMGLTD